MICDFYILCQGTCDKHAERRRSTRILALEEKKQAERERKLALALERKKNSAANHENINKGKEKVNVGDDNLDDEHGSGKSKAPRQLNSSAAQEEQHHLIGGSSIKNVSSQNSIPEKHVLESILDELQRKDKEELFAMPVIDPDVVEEGKDGIWKQPMDFGTMRAKLHEGMYTNLEQFKHDIYLICSSAMNGNPATSRHHKVAEAISNQAKRLLEGLSADPEEFGSAIFPNKRHQNRNSQEGPPRTSKHARVPPKPAGSKKATHSVAFETEKRHMYCPPSNNSLVSDFVNVNKFNIQLIEEPSNYRDSLLKFVEDMGPVAKRVAAQKLEPLYLIDNLPGTETPHPTTPQAAKESNTPSNTAGPSLALSLDHKPPTILETSAGLENQIDNNTFAGAININAGAHQGNNINDGVYSSWKARATAILGNIFVRSDRGKSPCGLESSNARGTIDIGGPSEGKIVSGYEKIFSPLAPFQEGTSQTPKGKATVFTHVWPTQVIPPKPLEPITADRSHSGLSSFVSQSRPQHYSGMHHANHLVLSLLPGQPRPENSMPLINDSGLSLVSHVCINHPSVNHSMPQLELGESSNPRNNFSGQSIMPSQAEVFSNWNQLGTSFVGLGTPYEPGEFEALMGSSSTQYFNNTFYPFETSYEQVHQQASSSYTPPGTFFDIPMQIIDQPNPLDLFPQQEQPETSLNMGMASGGAMNYSEGGAAPTEQRQDLTKQFLWE
ncbi:hypothetical protein RIF29_04646 [Crotalaria pallida]|uniref:Bromo domain-containing protein n=1 Tax=Crotalaria pallida TaxID=3830 RepID=A0AAN9J188_CROPI